MYKNHNVCRNGADCVCMFCERDRKLMARIPQISDFEAERYGRIAANWHKRLFQKEIYPPINNEEA